MWSPYVLDRSRGLDLGHSIEGIRNAAVGTGFHGGGGPI